MFDDQDIDDNNDESKEEKANNIEVNKFFINFPKHLSAHTNDLRKINLASNNNSMHIPEQENILSLNGNINYTNENSAKDSESNEINISIISTTSKKLESSTVNKSDKLQNNNCNWDNKQSGRTSIEKAIYEEIIKEDFHKNDTDNLTNLSNILKNQRNLTYNMFHSSNKTFSNNNHFVYNNILRNEFDRSQVNLTSKKELQKTSNLDKGFISEHNNINPSDGSSMSSNTSSSNRKVNENKIYKLTQKVESMKMNSSNRLTGNSTSTGFSKKPEDSQEKVSCFGRMCGKK